MIRGAFVALLAARFRRARACRSRRVSPQQHRSAYFHAGQLGSRSARTNRPARISRGAERFSLARRGRRFHPGACRLGTNRMGPRAASFPRSDHAAAAFPYVLGHGGVAHGLERERRGVERSDPANAGLRRKAQREYFALGKDFLERGIRNNPDQPATLRIARPTLPRQISTTTPRRRELLRSSRRRCRARRSYDKRFAAYELSYCAGPRARSLRRAARSFTSRASTNGCRLCSRG